MTVFPFFYILVVLLLFVALIGVLEYIRRRSIEEIRARSFNAFLSFYEMKVDEFCKNKGDECRNKLYDVLVRELSRQIKENRIEHIDVERLYEEEVARVTN